MFQRGLVFAACLNAFLSGVEGAGNDSPAGRTIASDLRQISLDPAGTYRVRDISVARGDIKIYFNEGVLSFFTPVADHRLAAIFTTEGAEAGDAEIIMMPSARSERSSLASYTSSPNLDEHFTTAIFFFSDNTAQEILEQINRSPVREAPDLASEMAERVNPIARQIAGQLDIPLVESVLDHHQAANGLFYGVIAGRRLGAFDITYDPAQAESVSVGRVMNGPDKRFELWTNFRPRHAPPFLEPEARVRGYSIDANIHADLTMEVLTRFGIRTSGDDGRVLPLALSPRLRVSSARIDGAPAEIMQHPPYRLTEFGSSETLLLIAGQPLAPDIEHTVELSYGGSVIRQLESGEYFVDERNTWYPVYGPVAANFDLTFHCPDRLRLVSTGEPVSEKVEDGIRTVHRKTIAPAALAGFNLGVYSIRHEQHKSYAIEIDTPNTASASLTADPTLPGQTESILDEYTRRWIPLSTHTLAVSPIAGYFGQGFPGLIYLSSVSFIKEENRSESLRGSRLDAFFSELLLPHEIAHQWWGNIVRPADYRSAWIMEAMANLSALEYIERARGVSARNDILESYRKDLTKVKDGKTVESDGPVDFGDRLIDTHGMAAWHVILYEKGSWVLQMLRERLGEENFRLMQIRLLEKYAKRPLNNDEFRQVASSFLPPGQPDSGLINFFETWVYGVGVPKVALRESGSRTLTVDLSGVENDFMTEIPLHCKGKPTYVIRAGTGTNIFELPKNVSGCELPSPTDFLYIPAKSH